MDLYSVALFVHIVGAVLIFVLLTIEGIGYRAGFSFAAVGRVLGPISAVMIVVPGFYMAATESGWKPWVLVGLGSYAIIAGLGAYTGVSVMRGRMSARAARLSWLARIGIAVGVVFDMAVKPDLATAIAAVVVATGLAVATSLVRRRESVTA